MLKTPKPRETELTVSAGFRMSLKQYQWTCWGQIQKRLKSSELGSEDASYVWGLKRTERGSNQDAERQERHRPGRDCRLRGIGGNATCDRRRSPTFISSVNMGGLTQARIGCRSIQKWAGPPEWGDGDCDEMGRLGVKISVSGQDSTLEVSASPSF